MGLSLGQGALGVGALPYLRVFPFGKDGLGIASCMALLSQYLGLRVEGWSGVQVWEEEECAAWGLILDEAESNGFHLIDQQGHLGHVWDQKNRT